jgi:hypothetical protein
MRKSRKYLCIDEKENIFFLLLFLAASNVQEGEFISHAVSISLAHILYDILLLKKRKSMKNFYF